ncbi:MAG: exopolysaccharide biosynthesis polyprenyl glycosylphosphotransferase [Lutimonas sp.]
MPEKIVSFHASRKDALKDYRVFERKLLLALVDLLILLLAFYTTFILGSGVSDGIGFFSGIGRELIFGLVLFFSLGLVFNIYELEYVNKTRKVLPLMTFISGLTWGLTLFTAIILESQISVEYFLLLGFLTVFPLAIWRIVFATWIHTFIYTQNVILIGSGEMDSKEMKRIQTSIEGRDYDHGFKVLRSYQLTENLKKDQLLNTLKRACEQGVINYLVIVETDKATVSRTMNGELIRLMSSGVKVKSYPQMYEEIKEALPIGFSETGFYSMIPDARITGNHAYEFWHQSLNVISSVFGMLLFAIVAPLLMLLNPFFNKGPLFYVQKRVGKNGKEFELIKFRSMIENAEKNGARMSAKDDERVTPMGKLLRRSRIDELPQFWSVLKGEMNLIGPRPERKFFIDQWKDLLPQFESRHLIKPGITGWAQVKYPYGENVEDSAKKLEYDLYYLKNRSILLDIRILYKTVYTMIVSKGQ